MAFKISSTGELETTEARERALTGWVAGTIDDTHTFESTSSFDDADSIGNFFHGLGIHFTTPDNFISVFSNGSVEAFEFIEGTRFTLDNQARLTVTFLREVI